MKLIRKSLVLILVVCFMLSLNIPALAAWDLTIGDITIGFDTENQQIVSQAGGEQNKRDDNPTVTSNGAETANTIIINGTNGETVQMTVENLVIHTDGNTSGIDIQDGSTVVINVEGTNNSIRNSDTANAKGQNAAIHVGDADLTITGAATGENSLIVNDDAYTKAYGSNGAAIGSNNGEDFTGSITITGNVYVEALSYSYGAGIGSGNGGDFAGEVNITNGADVFSEGVYNSAAIGAGQNGDFTSDGSVTIDNATVFADTYNNGAAIGSGYQGDFAGSISITNSTVTADAGNNGDSKRGEAAAIGAGYNGDFSGSLYIGNSTVHAETYNDGAAIGAGGIEGSNSTAVTEDATITIHNSNVTAITFDAGTPIGAPEANGVFAGTITITGNSTLTLVDGKNKVLGDEVLIGGAVTGENASVTMDDTVTLHCWAGTRDTNSGTVDRYTNGTKTEATPEMLSSIINGGKLTIIETPKEIAAKPYMPGAYEIFWQNVKTQILKAQKDDEITLDARSYSSMPTYILDAVKEAEVTLIIQWNGGEDLVIEPDHDIDFDGKNILFTTLKKLLEEKAAA